LGALAVAAAGFGGHLAGAALYPQRVEQIPSDFFFVPLGLAAGFACVVAVRLARPQWPAARIGAAVALIGVVYASILFNYSRAHAIPARLAITFDPNPATAVACDAATCPQTDPPQRWRIAGRVRVQETAGIGGTVNAISLSSYPETAHTPHPVTREESDELNRFAGPKIRLTGRDLAGTRRLAPQDVGSYPLRYTYPSRDASQRTVSVYVEFTDSAGHPAVGVGQWSVR
jgi:hypothetical protein